MKKDAKVSFKLTRKEREEYENEAQNLGFSFSNGKVNFSKYLRWILEHGQKPIDRSKYEQLFVELGNLTRLGNLFNQYLFHLNRELKILNDHADKNAQNKTVIKSIETTEKDMKEMRKIMIEIRKNMHEIVKKESA